MQRTNVKDFHTEVDLLCTCTAVTRWEQQNTRPFITNMAAVAQEQPQGQQLEEDQVEEQIVYVAPSSTGATTAVETDAPNNGGAAEGGASKKARRKRGKGFRLTTRRTPSRGKRKRAAEGDADGGVAGDLQPPSAKRQLSQSSALLKYEHRLNQLPAAAFAVFHEKWISIYDKTIRHKNHVEDSFPVPWTAVLQRVAAKHGALIKGVLPHYHRGDPPIYEVRPNVVEERHKSQYPGDVVVGRVFVPAAGPSGRADPLSVFSFGVKDRRNDTQWQELAKTLPQQQ